MMTHQCRCRCQSCQKLSLWHPRLSWGWLGWRRTLWRSCRTGTSWRPRFRIRMTRKWRSLSRPVSASLKSPFLLMCRRFHEIKTAVVQLMSSSCWLNCTCLLLAKNQEMHICLSVSADDILYPWAVISLCVFLQVSWNISIFLCVSSLSWSLQATEILVPRFLGGWGDGTAGFFFGTDQERFTTPLLEKCKERTGTLLATLPTAPIFFCFSAVGSHRAPATLLRRLQVQKRKDKFKRLFYVLGMLVVLFN